MTPEQIVKAAIPNADHGTVEHVLWGMTPFPCGAITAQMLYRAASRLRRATANGITLCDGCDNRAVPGDFWCKACRDAMRTCHGEQE